jgi:hypothetical protein
MGENSPNLVTLVKNKLGSTVLPKLQLSCMHAWQKWEKSVSKKR